MLTVVTAQPCRADWDSCIDSMGRLQWSVSFAGNKAHAARMATRELKKCRENPEDFDYFQDHCKTLARELDETTKEYIRSRSDLKAKTDTADDMCRDAAGFAMGKRR